MNAAEFAVRYVTVLLELRGELMLCSPQNGRFQPPWPTINIGRVSGGVAHNVIVGKTEVDWEMRPVQDSDADCIKAAMVQVADRD